MPLLRKEERKAGEVDDLLIGLDLCEIRPGRQIGGERRRDSQLRVHPGLPADETVGEARAVAVVCGLNRPTEDVRVELDVAAASQSPEIVQFAGVQELIEALCPTPGAPEILFVLAADEPQHVKPELHAGAGTKAQRPKGNAEFRGPAGAIPRDRDVPDAVPIRIEVVEVAELRIPACAAGVGSKDECPAAVVETVDQQQHMVIARQVCVAPQLRGAQPVRLGVVGAHANVERRLVSQCLDRRAFRRLFADHGLTLAEIGERVRARPVSLVQPAVEMDSARGRPDAKALCGRRHG